MRQSCTYETVLDLAPTPCIFGASASASTAPNPARSQSLNVLTYESLSLLTYELVKLLTYKSVNLLTDELLNLLICELVNLLIYVSVNLLEFCLRVRTSQAPAPRKLQRKITIDRSKTSVRFQPR